MTENDSNAGIVQVRSPFGTAGLRLNTPQWATVAILVTLVFWLAPIFWKRAEPFEPGEANDYRLPYASSRDYWLFSRLCEAAAAQTPAPVFVVGDSVIWGEYVSSPADALPSQLERSLLERKGDRRAVSRFINLGLNGSHPLAISGLLEHHATALRDAKVLLHCNLLWMSSPRHDLSDPDVDEEFRFNHAELVPQVWPPLPSYHAGASERLSRAIERRVEFFNWVHHLRVNYFENRDLYGWTIDHPRDNPLAVFDFNLAAPETALRHPEISWTERGIRKQNLEWVEPEASLQWRAFRSTVEMMLERGHSLFVLVGPFNEHLLEPSSLQRYRELRVHVESWLQERGVPAFAPPALASERYADASHPLAEGYAEIARQLAERREFQSWLQSREESTP